MTDFPADTGDIDELDEVRADALELFITTIVGAVVRNASLTDLFTLAETMAPGLPTPDSTDDPHAQRAMARMLARSIADQTPCPDARFAIRKRARPGRNDACDCGSGRKYKQCCQLFEQRSPFAQMNLLPYLLDVLPRKRWGELVGSAIDLHAVEHAAQGMIEDGDLSGAVALLEPWFKTQASIPASHELLLDCLLDACTGLDQPRKKRRLMEQALAHGDHVIRSSIRQRLATMAADEGDYPRAWELFRQAQRDHADAASLSHLEVILLLSQGEQAQARERARFWIARLSRIDAAGHAELIGFLRKVVAEGEQALLQIQTHAWPELPDLQALLKAAPPPQLRYSLAGGNAETAGALQPDRALASDLKAWGQVFPQIAPSLTGLWIDAHPAWDDPPRWLQCLRKRPSLWQSFDVLDNLVLALTGIFQVGMAPLRDALLDRAEALLRMTLASHPGKILEWPHMANRPALRLIAQRIATDPALRDADTLQRMKWMLALNPGDNHGYRHPLMAALLRGGDAASALALAERFGEDSELGFGRVLALYALERRDVALQALREAHTALPRIAPLLVASKPRKPRLNPGWRSYGGADQAWYFREANLSAWQHHEGALDWLREALRAIKRKKPLAP